MRDSLRPALRPPPARVTNLLLFAALLLVFGTGLGAVLTGTGSGYLVVVGHGVAALGLLLLAPWKSRVVRAGLPRHRYGRWPSLLLAGLVLTTVGFGLGYATGLVRSVGGLPGMWVHVALALVLVPLAGWHLVTRWRRPRRTDLSRRLVLRTALLGAGAGALYAGLAGVVAAAALPGARRRFTGSYQAGTDAPEAMPANIWLDDAVPALDPARYRLVVVDAAGRYELGLADLAAAGTTTVRALLDCTSGWYAVQDWTGVPVAALLRERGSARSLYVHSVTGYRIRLPLALADRALLATGYGGRPLLAGHGYPARLVVPGRRGYWWVKWVDRIEVSSAPPWWQPPLPLT